MSTSVVPQDGVVARMAALRSPHASNPCPEKVPTRKPPGTREPARLLLRKGSPGQRLPAPWTAAAAGMDDLLLPALEAIRQPAFRTLQDQLEDPSVPSFVQVTTKKSIMARLTATQPRIIAERAKRL